MRCTTAADGSKVRSSAASLVEELRLSQESNGTEQSHHPISHPPFGHRLGSQTASLTLRKSHVGKRTRDWTPGFHIEGLTSPPRQRRLLTSSQLLLYAVSILLMLLVCVAINARSRPRSHRSRSHYCCHSFAHRYSIPRTADCLQRPACSSHQRPPAPPFLLQQPGSACCSTKA